jgi:hypothetical protein
MSGVFAECVRRGYINGVGRRTVLAEVDRPEMLTSDFFDALAATVYGRGRGPAPSPIVVDEDAAAVDPSAVTDDDVWAQFS